MSFEIPREMVMSSSDHRQNRWYIEAKKIQKFFPRAQIKARSDLVTAVEFQIKQEGGSYPIYIEIPPNYPYEIPNVYALWNIPSGTPHTFSTGYRGRICPMHRRYWSKNLTIAFLIAKTAKWVHKYLVWRRTERWPGRQE